MRWLAFPTQCTFAGCCAMCSKKVRLGLRKDVAWWSENWCRLTGNLLSPVSLHQSVTENWLLAERRACRLPARCRRDSDERLTSFRWVPGMETQKSCKRTLDAGRSFRWIWTHWQIRHKKKDKFFIMLARLKVAVFRLWTSATSKRPPQRAREDSKRDERKFSFSKRLRGSASRTSSQEVSVWFRFQDESCKLNRSAKFSNLNLQFRFYSSVNPVK